MTPQRARLSAGLFVLAAAAGLQQPLSAQFQPAAPAQTEPQGTQGGRGQRQTQPRDGAELPQGTGSISGRVLTADTGRPVKHARVTVSGGARGGRTTTTDDQGRYQITELSAGSYTITGSKNGFVDASHGQRRPRQPGMPVTIADAQAAANIDLRLIRGGVITGAVLDEDGEPLVRALVSVQRYQYVQGQRQLTPAGADQTDDRGQYRVFGLPPGDYYVSVSAAGLGQGGGRGFQPVPAGIAPAGGRGGPPGGGVAAFAVPGTAAEPESTGYAPTYYPGVVSAPEAGKVNVAPGQEVGGIDFQIQLVPLATVGGIVAGADDVVPVMLVPQDASGTRPLGGQVLSGRSQADGTFAISNVPPGRYLAVARSGGRNNDSRSAVQSIVVNGQNLGGVSLVLQPGGTLSGNITVESSGTPAPGDYSGFRVEAPDVTPLPFGGAGGGPGGGRGGAGGGGGGRAEKNGAFAVGNLLPGQHYIRVAITGGGPGRGQAPTQGQGPWMLKSVLVGGQDVTDQAVDLKPGQNIDNVTIVLTDRSTEIAGLVRDRKNVPLAGMTVVVFSSDQQYWRAQSRHIQAARTDSSGAFRLRGLPAGDYLIIAVDDVEQEEWFDPTYLEQIRATATRVTISEGEKKTKDLPGPGAS